MYEGACHCGNVKVALHSNRTAAELGARSCQCAFCRLHGASWTSDPAGTLEITVSGDANRYQFGTGTAEFLVCKSCGVVTAATWSNAGAVLSVVRVECLQRRDGFLAARRQTDFDSEDLAERLARRSRSWTPTIVRDAGTRR